MSRFKENCGSDVKALCTNIIESLRSVIDEHPGETESAIRSLAFVSRIANDLPSSLVFASSVECERDVMRGERLCSVSVDDLMSSADFSRSAEELCDLLVDRWREYMVSKIVRDHWHTNRPPSGAIPNGDDLI